MTQFKGDFQTQMGEPRSGRVIAPERENEKAEAVEAIEQALTTIENQTCEPDQWERALLVQAVGALFRGGYRLATVDAELALTPPNERSRAANLRPDPFLDRYSMSVLRAALREAVAQPLRDFPHFGPIVFTREHAVKRDPVHRPLDPRRVNVSIDANALDKNGTTRDMLVDRMLELRQADKVRVLIPAGVRDEVQHPQTPQQVKETILPEIYTIPTELNSQERDFRRRVAAALQGNAAPGKHAPDAYHLAEAAKYGGYFITHDERVLKKSGDLRDLLPPSLQVVTLERFLEIFDEYESGL
jgi:predicted nucleic acid-binding protein